MASNIYCLVLYKKKFVDLSLNMTNMATIRLSVVTSVKSTL